MNDVLFREEQRFRQPWLWALLIGIAALETGLFAYGTVRQIAFGRPWGDRPLSDTGLLLVGSSALLLSLGLLVLFARMRLVTEVRSDGLYVRFVPFHLRPVRFSCEDLRAWEAVTYNPLLEYGGWGIRYGLKGKAYNVSGNRGVRLEMRDGKRLLLGSQRPEELSAALGRLGEGG